MSLNDIPRLYWVLVNGVTRILRWGRTSDNDFPHVRGRNREYIISHWSRGDLDLEITIWGIIRNMINGNICGNSTLLRAILRDFNYNYLNHWNRYWFRMIIISLYNCFVRGDTSVNINNRVVTDCIISIGNVTGLFSVMSTHSQRVNDHNTIMALDNEFMGYYNANVRYNNNYSIDEFNSRRVNYYNIRDALITNYIRNNREFYIRNRECYFRGCEGDYNGRRHHHSSPCCRDFERINLGSIRIETLYPGHISECDHIIDSINCCYPNLSIHEVILFIYFRLIRCVENNSLPMDIIRIIINFV